MSKLKGRHLVWIIPLTIIQLFVANALVPEFTRYFDDIAHGLPFYHALYHLISIVIASACFSMAFVGIACEDFYDYLEVVAVASMGVAMSAVASVFCNYGTARTHADKYSTYFEAIALTGLLVFVLSVVKRQKDKSKDGSKDEKKDPLGIR